MKNSSQWGRTTYSGQTVRDYYFNISFNKVFSMGISISTSEGAGMILDNNKYYIDTSIDVGTINVAYIAVGI